jgi:two-component system sensor histidine kinase/response regulator
MPGVDGFEATRQIKQEGALRQAPAVVMVTAFGREEVRDEAERAGIEAFLVKPVTKSTLVDTLVTLFSPGSAETGATSGVAAERGVRLDGLRVLLVEDNEINQQVAVELIEGVGGAVTVAGDGRRGVELLEALPDPVPFGVVLMDIQMPEMDGFQATARIRSQARFASLPIVAMTAHATVEERQRCVAAGMADHVAKPIDPAVLYDVLSRFCAGAPSPSPAAPAPHAPSAASPEIAGLDFEQGLRRVAGNRTLYVSLLGTFAESQADAAERIREALAEGDRSLAERLAHTVRGTAANLAAGPVQAAAAALEKALREHAEAASAEALRVRLGEALARLRSSLRPLLEATTDARPAAALAPSAVDPATLRATVARWSRLLEECDAGTADDLVRDGNELRALFGAAAAFSRFEKLVKGYEFEGALGALRRAAQERGL